MKYGLLVFISIILFSCNTSRNTISPRNFEQIYNPASSSVHPEIAVYNSSDTSSLIVEKIYTKELLFNNANSDNELLARVKVIYNLYDIDNKHAIIDSSTMTYKFEKDSKVSYHIIEIPVYSRIGNTYILEIITSDLNRKSHQYTFCRVNRNKELSNLDVSSINKSNGEIILDPYIKTQREFLLKNYKKDYDSLFVHFYSNDFTTPDPPFMEDTVIEEFETPDTNWVCYLDSVKYQNFSAEGIYYFTETEQLDLEKGFSLFNFGERFPLVQTPTDLAKPIVYLDSLDLIQRNDSTGKLTKLSVDNYWLGKANNMDKSRELLKIYYNRVMFANMYFTSYKEGWQTDRGMIYIIYGLPDYLFKSGNEERWIYNPEGTGPGITFIFKHIQSPFSSNHYILDREKLKATGWYDAIKMWEKGEVLYFQN